MTRFHGIPVGYPIVLLGLCLAPSPAAAFVPPMPLGLLDLDRMNQIPGIRALDPEEVVSRLPVPDLPERPIQREREAILPNPLNGQELVSRVLADGKRGELLPLWMTAPEPGKPHSWLR